jgi:ATPase subunit of ABC transporter with duplicated ATPase domains
MGDESNAWLPLSMLRKRGERAMQLAAEMDETMRNARSGLDQRPLVAKEVRAVEHREHTHACGAWEVKSTQNGVMQLHMNYTSCPNVQVIQHLHDFGLKKEVASAKIEQLSGGQK